MNKEITLTGTLVSKELNLVNAPKVSEAAKNAMIDHTFIAFSNTEPAQLDFFYGEQKPDVRLTPGNWAFAGMLAAFVKSAFDEGIELHGALTFTQVGRVSQHLTVSNGEVFAAVEHFDCPSISKAKSLVNPTVRFMKQ